MNRILGEIGGSFYVTQLSAGSVIVMVFSMTLAVFFLIPKKKSGATLHLGLAYLFLSLFHLAYFVSFSFFHPMAAWHRWLTVPAVMAAEVHLTGFILQYPENNNNRLSRIITRLMYLFSAISTLVFYSRTMRSAIIFNFDGHFYDFNAPAAAKFIGLVILLNAVFFLVALAYRIYQLRGDERMRMIILGVPCVIGATAPALLNVLNRDGYITREYFQVFINMCHLFSWLLMALLHLNTTRERFTFMGKIVGVSIVTFLAVFILNSHLTLIDMDRTYDDLKLASVRLHVLKHSPDDGIVFMKSCLFSPVRNNCVIEHNSTGALLPESSSEYFNTMVYEEIKRLPDEGFNEKLEKLLASGNEYFSGYRVYILNYNRSLTGKVTARGAAITRRLDHIHSNISFLHLYILSLGEENFWDEIKMLYPWISPELSPFRGAMLSYSETQALDGPELKANVSRFIDPMLPSGSRIYRADSNGSLYTSYIYYDRGSMTVYEAGFPYMQYRMYMHETASRMIIMILAVIIFMIAVYPFFFFGTMYTPLSTLLKGVKRIINGELDFRIDVRIEDEIGEITRTFNTMTDRLRENRDEITRSAARFRELADMLPDIIYETDIELKIIYMNRAGHQLVGYSSEDVSSGITLAMLLSERDFRSIRIFSEKCSDIEDAVFSRTHEIRKKNGKTFAGENRAVFIYNEKGVSGLRGIIRDVTEKLKIEESLLQAQKMETIGTLVAGLAHDFNNILGGITGPLSIIRFTIEKNGSIDAGDFNLYLETMDESSRRAVDLVQQLVNLSRKDSISLVPVDLVQSLKHVIRICSSAFDKSIGISADIPDYQVMVMGDATQLEQMLLNLCINGSHAMTIMRPQGDKPGGTLKLSVDKIFSDEHFMAVHPEARARLYWRLSVSDTGVGIDSDTVSKIFIPFFTTKERGTGTGLGLAMVYSIVRHHRGFIDVYSEPGTGTTFSVFIPVLEGRDESAAVSAKAAIPRGSGLILVADDEEAIRLIARIMLEKCGYDIITAVDGEDAVRAYREHAADVKLVVLDLLMPKMSGEAAALELRKLNPEVKILLASGMINDERADRLARDEKCVFIHKPYTFEALSRSVYNLINDIKQ